ncbi:erythromycin esterase [Microbacterium resistens]|uniref:Erythromycin esterase n=1 Tax=Microbacterium resistens TaxID=156977 RepID=A0ABU1SG58_9MICO|nr:erythromycin esterase family protein [Microbacterium resistens]MDR6868600.1 erythromycin esterase [Microbacterium resistens]
MSEIELTAWIRSSATRLRTLDPDDEDDSDLEPVLEIVGDARVVAIGESMHRVHEFLQIRHRLFRFLARRAGFTTLVLESGFPETIAADAWTRRGDGGLREVLRRGITYGFGACQEVLDQLTWMRERNAKGDGPVRLRGMDIPDSSASALPGVLAALSLADETDPEYARHVRATLLPRFGYLPTDRSGLAQAAPTIQAYLALPAEDRAALTTEIGDLAWRMRARRPDALALLGGTPVARERVDEAIRAADSARAADAFLQAMTHGAERTWPPANVRDAWMADSVEWVLEREPRVLVAAANGHVQRTRFSAPPFAPEPMTTLGGHLAARLGDDLVVIGTAFGGGEQWLHRPDPQDPPGHSRPFVSGIGPLRPDSVDAAIARAGTGDALLDLRSAPPAAAAALDATAGLHNGDVLQPLSVREAFDALVFVDRVTPWHTWVDERGLA